MEDHCTEQIKYEWNQTAERSKLKIIGYAAYFSLINGFEKADFWSVTEADEHGKKFSKSYSKSDSVWKKDFDSMAKKTVLKLLLGKYAPLSVEMQKAIVADQAIINDVETMDVNYVDICL